MYMVRRMVSGQSSMKDGQTQDDRIHHGRTLDGRNQVGGILIKSRTLKEVVKRNQSHHQHKNLRLKNLQIQSLTRRF